MMLKKAMKYLPILCLILWAANGVAKADTIGPNCGSCQNTITDLGSIYTVTYTNPSTDVYDFFLTVDTTGSTVAPGYLNAVSLKVVSGLSGDAVSLLSAPAAFDQGVEDGGISAGGCHANANNGFFCSGTSGSGVPIGGTGDVYNFEWELDGSLTLLGSGSSIKASYVDANGKNLGITSRDICPTPGSTPPVIPEPPTLLLLGTGLAALAGMIKLKSLA